MLMQRLLWPVSETKNCNQKINLKVLSLFKIMKNSAILYTQTTFMLITMKKDIEWMDVGGGSSYFHAVPSWKQAH